MKKLLISVIAFALLTAIPSQALDIADEQFSPSGPPVPGIPGYMGIHLEDGLHMTRLPSYLLNSTGPSIIRCLSLEDPKCSWIESFRWRSYLAPCESLADFDCIQSVTAIKESGERVAGTLRKLYPEKFETSHSGSTRYAIPAGKTPGLWNFAGISHAGGADFFVASNFESYNWTRESGSQQTRIQTGIYPVQEQLGRYTVPTMTDPGGLQGGDYSCVFTMNGSCLKRYSFPENMRFELALRLQTKVVGWIHGRMQSPDVTMEKQSSGGVLLTISALPVEVPVAYGWSKNSDLPTDLNDYLNKPNMVGGSFYYGRYGDTRENVSVLRNANSEYDENTFKEFAMWLPVLNEKAAAVKSTWSFRTLGNWLAKGAESCFSASKELQGVVTTNATVYVSSPPTFNKQLGILEYRVASPHFDKTGVNELKGNYDLAMRSDVARCLYNYTDAPVSATISVVSSNGVQQSATVAVGERKNWLYLSARNFGYSTPTLKVKLTQKKNQTYSINCVKGSKTKKVTGTSPKCPSGFRKAA
jgi:hypothetical protein